MHNPCEGDVVRIVKPGSEWNNQEGDVDSYDDNDCLAMIVLVDETGQGGYFCFSYDELELVRR